MTCENCPLNKTMCPHYDFCPMDVYDDVKKELKKHPPVLKAGRTSMPTGRALRRGHTPNAPGAELMFGGYPKYVPIICHYPKPCGTRANGACMLAEKCERWKA